MPVQAEEGAPKKRSYHPLLILGVLGVLFWFKYREPLVLHHLQGLSRQQVAERLGMSVATVDGRLKRGRKQLKLRLLRRGVEFGAVLAAIVWIACGASIGFDVWGQETHPAGVVVADEVVVRKGNGEGFEPQLEQPLTEGVEFVVLEARDDWLMIELPDGNTGWIKASQAELI